MLLQLQLRLSRSPLASETFLPSVLVSSKSPKYVRAIGRGSQMSDTPQKVGADATCVFQATGGDAQHKAACLDTANPARLRWQRQVAAVRSVAGDRPLNS